MKSRRVVRQVVQPWVFTSSNRMTAESAGGESRMAGEEVLRKGLDPQRRPALWSPTRGGPSRRSARLTAFRETGPMGNPCRCSATMSTPAV